jgi:hypothetical protein
MKRLIVIFTLLLSTSCYRMTSHDAPAGQPPLANLDVSSFRQQFNTAPGPRLLLLLSPT